MLSELSETQLSAAAVTSDIVKLTSPCNSPRLDMETETVAPVSGDHCDQVCPVTDWDPPGTLTPRGTSYKVYITPGPRPTLQCVTEKMSPFPDRFQHTGDIFSWTHCTSYFIHRIKVRIQQVGGYRELYGGSYSS